jgi:hypothetical protein
MTTNERLKLEADPVQSNKKVEQKGLKADRAWGSFVSVPIFSNPIYMAWNGCGRIA